MVHPATMTDADFAAHLAETAGKLLLEVRSLEAHLSATLGPIGDETANRYLCREIRAARPQDGLLSEEEIDNGSRLGKSRVWIIDPLDGTREFGERRSDWAVHVALAIDGVPVIGAVALPDIDGGIVLRSDKPGVPSQPNTPLRMVVSRTRPAPEAVAVAKLLGAELVAMGSAGAKAMAVVRGEADIYLHSGGQYEWDSCAPVAVAAAYGLHVSRIDGAALVYNQADAFMPDLLICAQSSADTVIEALKRIAAMPRQSAALGT